MNQPAPHPRQTPRAGPPRHEHPRLRRFAWRGGVAAGVLLVVAAGLLYWLLGTGGGRDALLAQVVARLPPGASLTWRQAEGPASGPLTLRGVRFSHDGIEFTAQRVTLDPALWPLLGRTLRLDALRIEQATLALPERDEPFELPRWPEVLPDIAPPLALRADDIRIDGFRVFDAAGETTIDVRTLRGGVHAQPGRLDIEQLRVDSDRGRFGVHGTYRPDEDYRTDLTVTALLPAAGGRSPARLGLVARGDLARMDVAVAGAAPGPLRGSLVLRGRAEPRWRLDLDADALDPGLLTGAGGAPSPTPLALQLQAEGVGGDARVQGEFTQGEFSATVRPSRLRIEDQVLEVQPLALELLGGQATLRGRADLSDPDARRFRFAVNARGLTWGGAQTAAGTATAAAGERPVIVADAAFGLAGTLAQWAVIGDATLARAGEVAQLRVDGRGDAERLVLRTFEATMPTGTLDVGGAVAWAPALGWELQARLAGFDPGYFAAGWDGAINGELRSEGRTRDDGGLDVRLDAPQLQGRLRGRPLEGRVRFGMRGPASAQSLSTYEGEIALSLGDSRIEARGTVADRLDIDARLTPLRLDDLLPDATGSVRGALGLTGTRSAPTLAVDLAGSDLRYAAYAAETFSLDGRLPWRGDGGALALRATGLQLGVALDVLSVEARGAVESLQLEADARGEVGALSLSGDLVKRDLAGRGQAWQGTLASLQLAPARGAAWTLQDPARFSWSPATAPGGAFSGTLSETCLAPGAGASGALCLSADWPQRGFDIEGTGLPLSLAQAYLPARGDGQPWLLSGEVAIQAQLRPLGDAWRGELALSSAAGGLKFSERARGELLRYSDLSLSASFDPQRLQAELSAALFDDGRIEARLATGWEPYAPLIGEFALDADELTWMELLSPDIVEPQGRLQARLGLSGTRAQPLLDGNAQLSGFTAELPALAIVLRDGNLTLDARPDGTASLDGSVGTGGEGTLRVDGVLGWQGGDASGQRAPLVLNVRGEDVLVSNTRDLRAVISPDLQVRYAAGQPLSVIGTVGVPSARIDLERLDRGVAPSPDVVVLDPADPEDAAATATPLRLDLLLVLGEAVELSGFGLEGGLDGRLRVRTAPGREMTASGRLEVEGEYSAYGQELQITRGQLSWSNSPIADPVLDVRAQRSVGEVVAGVEISGRASAPEAEVWSNPATSQSEALAYLALGRPLSRVSGDEGRQLNAASAALTAGGGLLAAQIGARIGLDDAGVMQSRALGGNVFGIGKFLSPRLYIGYGVSLLGTGQVLTLKYLLRRGFDIEIESSSIENRASLNWRIEK
ncbi:translocation/assembly module TamB domain-containing protein [Lysobacter sp. D1-1-M9]|uniref:translocation/assembly module TamB domain-containing protein n=3 Tax=Novilysobacter TaxID=3382699 RepID=UPI0039836729